MRTALFDLDGTLVDSVPDLMAALNRLLASRGLPPFDVAGVTPMMGDGAAALVRRAFAARARAPDANALAEFLADYTAHAVIDTRPYPGIADALAALRDAGWTMAVATNKPTAAARLVLDGTGLAPFFAAVGGGDSFAVRKPDPAHLTGTLAMIGATVAGAVMVGDQHHDIQAARAAGMPAILCAWGYGSAEPGDATARAAAELPGLMARLVAFRAR